MLATVDLGGDHPGEALVVEVAEQSVVDHAGAVNDALELVLVCADDLGHGLALGDIAGGDRDLGPARSHGGDH